MAIEVVTKEDLQLFRMQLLDDLRQIFAQQVQPSKKKWLKSVEVRKFLNISAGKLQNLRITGKLPFTRIGGILYYQNEDVEKLFGS
jgi:hypothetical protein